nr:hypothetical protein GOBAR_DD21807 [Ipomoea batatas]
MAIAKGLNMILEGSLVLEIRAADAIPDLAAVLLVRPPVALHGQGLPTFPAHERLRPVLSLVVCLEGSEVFQWPGSWVINVVLAAWPQKTGLGSMGQAKAGLGGPHASTGRGWRRRGLGGAGGRAGGAQPRRG